VAAAVIGWRDRSFFEGVAEAAPSTAGTRDEIAVVDELAHSAQSLWDSEVLARCRQGEERAWSELYAANFDFVYRTAWRLGADASEVEDICQDVFIVAFRRLSSFVEGRFTTWLYRVVANVVSERHRQRRFREGLRWLFGREPAVAPPPLRPDRVFDAREDKAVVDAVLRRMAARKREVLVLFEIEGLPGDKVAELVGCKLETVWSRLHYARRDFERILRSMGHTP
jgi:RNA polymerase sigma-70 factor, ECF subfamily